MGMICEAKTGRLLGRGRGLDWESLINLQLHTSNNVDIWCLGYEKPYIMEILIHIQIKKTYARAEHLKLPLEQTNSDTPLATLKCSHD